MPVCIAARVAAQIQRCLPRAACRSLLALMIASMSSSQNALRSGEAV